MNKLRVRGIGFKSVNSPSQTAVCRWVEFSYELKQGYCGRLSSLVRLVQRTFVVGLDYMLAAPNCWK